MWRVAAASCAGTAHLEHNTPCQDAHRFAVVDIAGHGSVFIGVVSDGAGSARYSDRGAWQVCESAISHMVAALEATAQILIDSQASSLPPPRLPVLADLGTQLVDRIQQDLAKLAIQTGCTIDDLAATMLVCVATPAASWFAQRGDGVMVVKDAGSHSYEWVFWPENGEVVNETTFVTASDWATQFACTRRGPVTDVALLSDGMQSLALRLAAKEVHEPFFTGLFSPIRVAAAYDPALLSDQLKLHLSSPRVNARTNDDKTLVLACDFDG